MRSMAHTEHFLYKFVVTHIILLISPSSIHSHVSVEKVIQLIIEIISKLAIKYVNIVHILDIFPK